MCIIIGVNLYSCIVDLIGYVGNLEEALNCLTIFMIQTWIAMIEGYAIHGLNKDDLKLFDR